MKKPLALPLIFICTAAWGQDVKQAEKEKITEAPYYRYGILAVINRSDIDPAPFSYVADDAVQSQISFKYDSPHFAAPKNPYKEIKSYGFIKLDAAATNGIATVFKKTNVPSEIGLTLGYTPSFWFTP
ncbi:hypothetical protein [Hymenobacter sp. YC55]|uniref:hypothetical protein n=1 Tax=Hymenobacter sp. YC55 TaxID=3034019 RepID=UPI0023F846E2|nr:hypothetical protein [Hymenobacter sp. YC55]MDF7815735.1 hypothetical protein [Hymenobacter sp. YC55]